MGEFVNDTLIIVPVFVKEQDDDLVEKIEKLTEVGNVHVVNQGKEICFRKEHFKSERLEVFYTEHPVGIWGALEMAYHDIKTTNDFPNYVVLNLAPKLFRTKEILSLQAVPRELEVDHVYGARSNIAASLGSKQRAYLECFFTTLAGIILGHIGALTFDGFTGLHLMTIERYLKSDWRWIEFQRGKEPWGGALISQIQSFQMKSTCFPVMINTEENRAWPSTLGDTEKKAVVNMLEKCRRLPIFAEVSLVNIGRALDQFPEDFRFQPWLNPKTAKDEVLEMFRLGGWEE